MARILQVTTCPDFKCDGVDEYLWLQGHEEIQEQARSVGCEIDYFLAAELGYGKAAKGSGILSLIDKVKSLGGGVWEYTLTVEGEAEITAKSRLIHIITGRNLGNCFATVNDYDYIWSTDHFMPLTSQVGTDAGSDHLPLISELAWIDD